MEVVGNTVKFSEVEKILIDGYEKRVEALKRQHIAELEQFVSEMIEVVEARQLRVVSSKPEEERVLDNTGTGFRHAPYEIEDKGSTG